MVVLYQAYGNLAPDEGEQPATLDSLFDLASVTKLFMATAFMILVDAGQVDLDQPVSEIVPEFHGLAPVGDFEEPLTGNRLSFGYPAQAVDRGQVTFRHLLAHTSGLAPWMPLYRLAEPQREALPAICQADFAYPTGARIAYSDLGFILLGEAIARLSGHPLGQAIQVAVLEPLGLRSTGYNPLIGSEATGPLEGPVTCQAHIAATEVSAWRQRRLRGEVDDDNAAALGGIAGHAGLFGTAWDLAVFGQMHLNGGVYDSSRLLQTSTVAEMTREQAAFDILRRGLGWELKPSADGSCGRFFSPNSYGHRGFTGTSLWIDPERALLVVCLTNRVHYGLDPEPITAFRPALHEAISRAMVR
jgi:CubicO group peptidase (beta-lactamase class C family)